MNEQLDKEERKELYMTDKINQLKEMYLKEITGLKVDL